MRTFLFLMTSVTVIALAFWAYRENYDTQSVMKEARQLQVDISGARERLRVLNAEWAYLNRPERLRELVNMNFARLELLPIDPEQYSSILQIPFPEQIVVAEADAVDGAVDGAVDAAVKAAIESTSADAPKPQEASQ